MPVFHVGDKVEVLDEVVSGQVTQVSGGKVTIETEDGFELDFEPSQLVRMSDVHGIRVSNHEAAQAKREKETNARRPDPVVRPKQRNAPKMQVDLHIHKLTDSVRGMSNFDMLNLQIETAKRQLEFAIRKRIQKIVFIHGVGEGVLREELYTLFRRYENLKFYDADYKDYGLGATEVYIFQNLR